MWLATKAELLYWWGGFEEEKCYTFYVVPNCCMWDTNSKISCLHVASFLGRRASENLDCSVTLHKMSTPKNCILNFLSFTWTKIFYLACLTAKTEVILIKPFCPFLEENKKIHNKLQFQILFLVIFLWFIKQDSVNFQIIYIFKVLAIFWKLKLCRACNASAGRHLLIFWNWPPKIYLISRNV